MIRHAKGLFILIQKFPIILVDISLLSLSKVESKVLDIDILKVIFEGGLVVDDEVDVVCCLVIYMYS